MTAFASSGGVAYLFLVRSMGRLLFVILSLSLLQNRMVAAFEPITIEGVFVDNQTGRGMAAARIELNQRHWRFSLEPEEIFLAAATTDSQGHFRFVGPWRGSFRLRCYSYDCRKMGTQRICGAARDLRIEAKSMNATR